MTCVHCATDWLSASVVFTHLPPVVPTLLFAFGAYLFWLNRAMLQQPASALNLSPTRYTPESVRAAAAEYARNPPDVRPFLPLATDHRYIVLGGAGFLGGWIVLQLLQRGENPRRIRVLDLQPPTRLDLLDAQLKGVDFIQADVSDERAVVDAFSKPWLDGANAPLTIFHTASNIRFFERHELQLPASSRVNVEGTKHVLAAARAVGASTLVYTSSGSICIQPSRFWIWPWEKQPERFVHLVNDATPVPQTHAGAWSNYAATKIVAERLVRDADRTVGDGGRVLRTACVRPGNGVFGPGGDVLCGAFLVRRTNPSWILSVIHSFCYVENVALAHLQLEKSLLDKPDVAGGDAFCVTDPNPALTYGDVATLESELTDGATTFPRLPPVLMLLIAHAVELYSHARLHSPLLARILPAVTGDIINLQPSLFSLTSAHLIFDDSRARHAFGYQPAYTTLQGLCKLLDEFKKNGGRAEFRQMLPGGGGVGFGLAAAQRGVAKAARDVGVIDGPGTPP